MKVILKNIQCIGFGSIPDVNIDFHNNKNTTAFLAHNGYGKTSIINAIKTALSGKKDYLAGRDKSGRDIVLTNYRRNQYSLCSKSKKNNRKSKKISGKTCI